MSSHTFDPNKITVEEIFRAKQARRLLLAKLPLEEKIRIVERLQSLSAALENEKLIFDSFLKACPDFAGEPISEWDVVEDWYPKRRLDSPPAPFDKRPDVICKTASGKKIGVELKSWVNREQITEARKQERIHDNILRALETQPPQETQHLSNVLLSAKQVRFDKRDAAHFRDQMCRLIERVDNDWLLKPAWQRNSSEDRGDLTAFPLLEKYLHRIRFKPASRSNGSTRRIRFRFPSGGRYSPDDMRETLRRALLAHRSDSRYKDVRRQVGLDEVYLLVHYDFKAFAYNTPFDAPNFGFKEAAGFASTVLDGDGGNFDRILLFHFLWGKEEAYRIL